MISGTYPLDLIFTSVHLKLRVCRIPFILIANFGHEKRLSNTSSLNFVYSLRVGPFFSKIAHH